MKEMKMTKDEAIALLDGLTDADPESAHGHADGALVSFLRHLGHDDVADAFDRACHRVGFWYA